MDFLEFPVDFEFFIVSDVIGAVIYAGKAFLFMVVIVIKERLFLFLVIELLLFYLIMMSIFYYSYKNDKRIHRHLDKIDRRGGKRWRRRRGEIRHMGWC